MSTAWYEYEQESDVLDVYFGGKRPAWTIELTPNIMISIDREHRQAVSLTLMDYMELKHITEWGMRSFPLTGLADLPWAERALVIELLNTTPVNQWLDVSSVQMLPDAPFAVIHLTPYAANQEVVISIA